MTAEVPVKIHLATLYYIIEEMSQYKKHSNRCIRGPGSWLLDPGSRILDPGSWIQDPGSRIPDPGSWIQDPGIQDPGSRIQDPESKILCPGWGSWILAPESSILHLGSRILVQDPGSLILDS